MKVNTTAWLKIMRNRNLVAVKPLEQMIMFVFFCSSGPIVGQSWPQDFFKRVHSPDKESTNSIEVRPWCSAPLTPQTLRLVSFVVTLARAAALRSTAGSPKRQRKL
jgi:hypothetical protein